MDSPDKRHTTNELWAVVNKQGEHISTLRTDVAGLKATMSTGFTSLDAQVQELLRLQHIPKEKPDFKGWLAVAVPFAFLIGALLMSVISPMRDDIRQMQRIQQVRADVIGEFYQFKGEVAQHDAANTRMVELVREEQQEINNEVDGLEQGLARMEGWADQIEMRLEDVDKHGSRRWVNGNSKEK